MHTKTPWTATEARDWMEHPCCHDAAITAFVDGRRQMLAETHSPEDAALIVKAVNSHEMLVEALQFIADGYENIDVNHVDYRVKVYQVALDALASIKETSK